MFLSGMVSKGFVFRVPVQATGNTKSKELLNSTKYDNFTTGGIVISTARIPHLPDHERRGGLKIHWIHSVP